MTAFLALMAGPIGKVIGWAMAAGAALLGLLAVRKSGQQAQENKELKQAVADAGKRQDVDAKVAALSPDDVDRQLRDQFSRK